MPRTPDRHSATATAGTEHDDITTQTTEDKSSDVVNDEVVEGSQEALDSEAEEVEDDAAADDGTATPAQESSESGADDGDSPAAVEYDPALLRAAGLTAEQAQSQFGGPEALERAVRLLDTRFVDIGRQRSAPQAPAQTAPPSQYTAAQQPPQQQAQPSADEPTLPPFQLPKPKENDAWDEDTKALVEALDTHYRQNWAAKERELRQQIQQQNEAVTAIMKEYQRTAQQQYLQEFDDFVGGLNDAWKPLLGDAKSSELPQAGVHFQNRVHLDSVAAQLNAGMQAQGHAPLPPREALRRALPIAFPDQQQESIRSQVRSQVSGRQRQKTNRPSKRRAKQLTGEERARNRWEKFFQQHRDAGNVF